MVLHERHHSCQAMDHSTVWKEKRWSSSTPSGRLFPRLSQSCLRSSRRKSTVPCSSASWWAPCCSRVSIPSAPWTPSSSGTFVPTGGTEEDAITTGLIPALADSAGIFVFLVMLGILVALISVTGASAAFGTWAAKHVKSRVGSQLATFALGVLIFVDDYFNCLTVGSVMRPVTDGHRVSRAKLAYLIDATAAPVCMIAPVSSWAAAVSGVASDLNVDGIQLFVQRHPVQLLFAAHAIVRRRDRGHGLRLRPHGEKRDGGYPRRGASARSATTSPSSTRAPGCGTCSSPSSCSSCSASSACSTWAASGILRPRATMSLILAFGNTDAFLALPWGSLIALVFTFVYLLLRRVVAFKESMKCLTSGFNGMLPAILILTFALTLKSMTSALGAAEFVLRLHGRRGRGPVQHASRHHLPGGVRTRVRHGHQLGHVRHPHPHRAAHLRQQPRAVSPSASPPAWRARWPATTARPFPTRPSWRRPART